MKRVQRLVLEMKINDGTSRKIDDEQGLAASKDHGFSPIHTFLALRGASREAQPEAENYQKPSHLVIPFTCIWRV